MATLHQYQTTLVQYISGVPPFLAKDALLNALQDLCKRGYCWLHDNSHVASPGQSRYALTLPEHTMVHSIVAAAIDGKALVQGQDFRLSSGAEEIELIKPMTGHLNVALSLYPTSLAETVPDRLFERFRTTVCEGAAAKLGQNEKEAWALSKNQIATYQQSFNQGCADARNWALNHASRLYEVQTKHKFF